MLYSDESVDHLLIETPKFMSCLLGYALRRMNIAVESRPHQTHQTLARHGKVGVAVYSVSAHCVAHADDCCD